MAFGKSTGGGRRSAKRVTAAQPALLITMADRHRALLFDISQGGAKLRAEKTPPVGTELFLQVGQLDVYARVAWKRGDICGLKFDRELRQWDVELLNQEANRGTKATLDPAERGGADEWVAGVAR
jgi:hypothetical protein